MPAISARSWTIAPSRRATTPGSAPCGSRNGWPALHASRTELRNQCKQSDHCGSWDGYVHEQACRRAANDGSPGDAPAGCPRRFACHVPVGHRWIVAHGPAPRHRTPAFGQLCGRVTRGAGVRCRPVALPLLPRLQAKHRAVAARLAAQAPDRASHEHAVRYRRLDPVDLGRAWLFLADRLRRGVQEADRRDPEQLATARTLTASPVRSTNRYPTSRSRPAQKLAFSTFFVDVPASAAANLLRTQGDRRRRS